MTGGLQYSYSSTGNNGQITQATDTLSGETIVYQYDSLRRLTSASSTPAPGSGTAAWNEQFGYDGFGNLTSKALNGAAQPNPVNPQTNQLSSAIYDPNGNMVSGAGATLTYNVDNRMISAAETSGGVECDEYAPDGKRIFRQLADGSQEFMLYGIQGELLGTFTGPSFSNYLQYPQDMNVHFAGRLIWHGNTDYGPPYGSAAPGAVLTDRLGTNRNGMRFYPYGDEITSSVNDQMKFATYIRDSYTGLDYADQRFYASTYGRFNTPDPYKASGGPSDPSSWNRYSYTRGYPVNRLDPQGLDDCGADWQQDTWMSGPCMNVDGYENVDLAGIWTSACQQMVDAFGPVPVPGLACNQYAAIMPVATSAAPQCPLIGIVGSYTVTNLWPVYAESSPTMASDVDEAMLILNNEGIVPQINSGYRGLASQASIPATNPNGVAAPGQSWHNVGLAIDIQLNPAAQTGQEIIAAMEEAGLTWGGTWTKPDNIHFQLPPHKINNGLITSGAPSPDQVASCQAEHPSGH